MTQVAYNPCKDGFAAKAWECLRRNEGFVKLVQGIKKADGADRDDMVMGESHEAEYGGNYAAALMIWYSESWVHSQSWPILRQTLRTDFEKLFSTNPVRNPADDRPQFSGGGNMPYRLERFDLDDVCPREPDVPGMRANARRVDTNKALDLLCRLANEEENHQLIAVPSFVRDDKHRKHILNAIEKLLPKSSLRAVWLKPDNRALGTRDAWDTFLKYEYWTKLGLPSFEASNLVAYQRAKDGEALKVFSSKAPLPDVYKFLLKCARHQRAAEVEKQVNTIEKSIKSVFPLFAPYTPK